MSVTLNMSTTKAGVPWRKWILRGVAGAFLLGALTTWIAGGALCVPHQHPVAKPKDLAVEDVIITNASGGKLHGWLAGPTLNRGVIILQHGVRTDRTTVLNRAQLFTRAGYGVLLYDFQAHGESPGRAITFGWQESRDAQAAVAFVKARFPGHPIGVDGVSLGAAAAVLADPPLEVQGLVLEMMYPTIVDATKDRIGMRLGPAGRWLSPLLTAQLRLRLGCGPEELRPIDHVGRLTVPKLFLAGTADRETPLSEAQWIVDTAAEPKQLVTFAGAKHEDLCRYAPEQFATNVLAFFERYLTTNSLPR